MKTTTTQTNARPDAHGNESLTKIAVALSAATVIQLVAMEAAGVHGPIWTTQGALAAATVGVAWRAGGTTPRNPLAFAALILGTILSVTFLGFTIAEA
jgi:hypothetical protein